MIILSLQFDFDSYALWSESNGSCFVTIVNSNRMYMYMTLFGGELQCYTFNLNLWELLLLAGCSTAFLLKHVVLTGLRVQLSENAAGSGFI